MGHDAAIRVADSRDGVGLWSQPRAAKCPMQGSGCGECTQARPVIVAQEPQRRGLKRRKAARVGRGGSGGVRGGICEDPGAHARRAMCAARRGRAGTRRGGVAEAWGSEGTKCNIYAAGRRKEGRAAGKNFGRQATQAHSAKLPRSSAPGRWVARAALSAPKPSRLAGSGGRTRGDAGTAGRGPYGQGMRGQIAWVGDR